MALKRFTSVTLVALVDHKVLFQFTRLTKYFIAYFTCIEMLSGVSVMENKYIERFCFQERHIGQQQFNLQSLVLNVRASQFKHLATIQAVILILFVDHEAFYFDRIFGSS